MGKMGREERDRVLHPTLQTYQPTLPLAFPFPTLLMPLSIGRPGKSKRTRYWVYQAEFMVSTKIPTQTQHLIIIRNCCYKKQHCFYISLRVLIKHIAKSIWIKLYTVWDSRQNNLGKGSGSQSNR